MRNLKHQDIINTISEIVRTLRPPTKLLVSEWADRERILSPESCAEPGRWYTSRVPYLKDIMNSFNDPETEEVYFMSSTQVGKTECLLNVIGYYMDQEPCPILVVMPNDSMAEAFSKERLSPMIRDTPCLKGRVIDAKKREGSNTISHKEFPGGYISIVSKNSPSELAGRPIRLLLIDESDRDSQVRQVEGNWIDVVRKRTANYWNRKIGIFSTPGDKETSKIEPLYKLTDMNKFYVPCYQCDHMQVLKWGVESVVWPQNNPSDAYYVCENCGGVMNDKHIIKAVKKGQWIATNNATA